MAEKGRRAWWVYAVAVAVLAASLWVGWRDNLNVPQDVVRETIRSTPRLLVQGLVQFVAPVATFIVIVRPLRTSTTGRIGKDNAGI